MVKFSPEINKMIKQKRAQKRLENELNHLSNVDESINADETSNADESNLNLGDKEAIDLEIINESQIIDNSLDSNDKQTHQLNQAKLTKFLLILIVIALMILAGLGVAYGYYYLNQHHSKVYKVESTATSKQSTKETGSSKESTKNSKPVEGTKVQQEQKQSQVNQPSNSQPTNQQPAQAINNHLPSVGVQGVINQPRQNQSQNQVQTQNQAQQSNQTQSQQKTNQQSNQQATNENAHKSDYDKQPAQSSSQKPKENSIASNPVYDSWDEEDELTIYDSKGNPIEITH